MEINAALRVPAKFITIIQQLYENAICPVIHEGKLTEPFFVQTGVRQGCLLSTTIFLIAIDWVMRKATKDKRMGILWTLTKQLEDLDFADDISLRAHRHENAQNKLEHVADEAEKVGLQININKTEVNNNRQEAIQFQGKEIKEADSFICLGSVVSKDGGTDKDIRNRINKARHAFNTLRPIWRATSLSLQNKISMFGTNVKYVLLYGSETWRVTKTSTNKLQTFINKCLQIRWPEIIPNKELWERSRQEQIIIEIKRRRWGWIGHTLRKPATNTTR